LIKVACRKRENYCVDWRLLSIRYLNPNGRATVHAPLHHAGSRTNPEVRGAPYRPPALINKIDKRVLHAAFDEHPLRLLKKRPILAVLHYFVSIFT